MQTLTVSPHPGEPTQTQIYLGAGLLQQTHTFDILRRLGKALVVICDHTTADLFGHSLADVLKAQGHEALLLTFPPGEIHKTRETKAQLEDQMLQAGVQRDWVVIGLGGGVVTDMAGFIAATYHRGLPLVLMPTTLLAMVDASVGGKTAVNTRNGKNLIGAYHWPAIIFMDTDVLVTLTTAEVDNGFGEMIKHALIADAAAFAQLWEQRTELKALKEPVISQAILHSIRIKQSIVERDSMEQGLRRMLNFGHTVGHAIEAISGYTVPHGRAVALGCLVESAISVKQGLLAQAEFAQISALIHAYIPDLELPFAPNELVRFMGADKKNKDMKIRCVLLADIGKAWEADGEYCKAFGLEEMQRLLSQCDSDLAQIRTANR